MKYINKSWIVAWTLAFAAVVYSLVPPPQNARAAFVDQTTYGGTSTGSVVSGVSQYSFTIQNYNVATPGVVLRFIPNYDSVGPTQININSLGFVNVVRPSSIGNVAFSSADFKSGELTCVTYNGTAYQLSCNVDITPIGKAVEFHGSATPRGTLIEDGSCVSRTTYAALFAVINTTYGACDGSTTFAVPDSRGTALFALDGQGANGLANRITSASCATPNAIGLCGAQLATLTPSLVPTLTSANATQSITVPVPGGAAVPTTTTGVTSAPPPTTGSLFAPVTSGTWSSAASFTGNNSISVTTSGTGGSSVTHPVLNPASMIRRAIKV